MLNFYVFVNYWMLFMSFESIKNFLKYDLNMVNNIIFDGLRSDIDLINVIGNYIISYGGKRIRPILAILLSKSFGYKGNNHLVLSAVIELIHTATLLHDDVVDISEKRRGKLTVNKKWGNREAILVGDFLYTRAFQIMLKIKNHSVLEVMANATNKLSEGEVIQLINKSNICLSEESYFNIIERKTAILFSAAAETSGIISSLSQENIKLLSYFGLHFGIAYQLIDDILDYSNCDKDIGNDFYEGIYTLPLIYLINNSSKNKKDYINGLLNDCSKDNFIELRKLILASNSIDYTFDVAKREMDKAINIINKIINSDYKNIIYSLSQFILNRKF